MPAGFRLRPASRYPPARIKPALCGGDCTASCQLFAAVLLTLFMDGSFQDEEAERIFDELTGKEFDSGEVRKAREEEIEFIRQLKVYEEVPETDCWANTGREQAKNTAVFACEPECG